MDRFSVRTKRFDLNSNPTLRAMSKVIILVFFFLIIVHWMGCIFFLVADWENGRGHETWLTVNGYDKNLLESSPGTQYLTSIYYALTTASTIGYGDFSPRSNGEMVVWLFTTANGMVMYASVFGVVSNIIEQSGADYRRRLAEIKGVETYCRVNDLPPELEARLVEYRTRTFDMNKGVDMKKIANGLPVYLKSQINMFLYRTEIEKVPFFNGCDDAFLRAIASKIEEQFCLERDYVIQVGVRVEGSFGR